MSEIRSEVYLRQRVQKIGRELVLLIPMAGIGDDFLECTRGIAAVQGQFLKVVLPDWLAAEIRIKEGSFVVVSNRDGKFNIQHG